MKLLEEKALEALRRTAEKSKGRDEYAKVSPDGLMALIDENLLLRKQLLDATSWTKDDKPLPEDAEINAAHPTRTGEHKLYEDALRMVSAKRSKYALVDLVNWLLSKLHDKDGEAFFNDK